MTGRGLRLARLESQHQLDGFDSGNEVLDAWLTRHGLAVQQMDTARTFLLLDAGDAVVGHFSLTMGSVLRHDAPAKLVHGLPKYPARIRPATRQPASTVPANEGHPGEPLAGCPTTPPKRE